MSYKVSGQSETCQDKSLVYHVYSHSSRKHAVCSLSWASLHYISFRFFNAQSQSREAVCYQIYPQQMYRLKYSKAQHRSREYTYYLTHIGRQKELDSFSYIVVDSPSFGNGSHYSGEVVICQHHISYVLGHVCSGYSHSYADIRRLYTRRIVYAVPCHRRDIALLFPHIYYAYFMFGLHSGIYSDPLYFFFKRFVVHLIEHGSGDGSPSFTQDAEFLAYGCGSIHVVACYHDRRYSGAVALLYSCFYLRPYRVYHPYKTYEAEISLHILRRDFLRHLIVFSVRGHENSKRFICHFLISRKDIFLIFIGYRPLLTAGKYMGTLF